MSMIERKEMTVAKKSKKCEGEGSEYICAKIHGQTDPREKEKVS